MAYTVPGTAVVGGIATASLWNAGVRDNMETAIPHLLARKTADESVTSSAVLQDDNHLFKAMAVNEVWYVRFVLRIIDNSSGVADFKCAFTIPSGATMAFSQVYPDNAGTLNSYTWTTSGTSGGGMFATNVINLLEIPGIVVNGANAGNLQLQWAQNTSNASSVDVKTNSCLLGFKLA